MEANFSLPNRNQGFAPALAFPGHSGCASRGSLHTIKAAVHERFWWHRNFYFSEGIAKFTAPLLCKYSPLSTHKMKQLLRKSFGLQVSTSSQGSWRQFVKVSDKSRHSQQQNAPTPPSSPWQLHFHTCFLTAGKNCSTLAVCWQFPHQKHFWGEGGDCLKRNV